MNITVDNFLIPAISAVIGMFWLLAYKHPKTFHAVSTPFIFIGFMVLIGSFGYFIAWGNFDISLASYNDIWNEFDDIERIDEVKAAVSNRVNNLGRVAIPYVISAGCVIAVMIFLLWVSRLLHSEKTEKTEPSQNSKEDNKPESDGSEQST